MGSANPVLKKELLSFNLIREGSDAVSPVMIENNKEFPSFPGLKTKSIALTNWKRIEATIFSADLQIDLESNSGPLAPILLVGVYLKTSGAGATKTIESCALGNMPGTDVSYYSISDVYIVKKAINEGDLVCCDKGTNDIVLSGDWSSYSGEKSTFTQRSADNHCMKFYEGVVKSQSGTIEMLCASMP